MTVHLPDCLKVATDILYDAAVSNAVKTRETRDLPLDDPRRVAADRERLEIARLYLFAEALRQELIPAAMTPDGGITP